MEKVINNYERNNESTSQICKELLQNNKMKAGPNQNTGKVHKSATGFLAYGEMLRLLKRETKLRLRTPVVLLSIMLAGDMVPVMFGTGKLVGESSPVPG